VGRFLEAERAEADRALAVLRERSALKPGCDEDDAAPPVGPADPDG
jgi:hypothetical protein